MTKTAETQGTTAMATTSARFVAEVERQFAAEMGSALAWTDYQKTLAQHLFLKVDAQLKALEAKREEGNRGGVPMTWDNVNLSNLALAAVHRVCLGLDALIPNHIHPIPYLNRRLGKYDLDLRIGYVGKLFCRQELAVTPVIDVICHLVHESDEFVPLFRSAERQVESYEFRVTKPFDRGPVVGGFGHIIYENPQKNRLVLVSMNDFAKAEAAARTKDFWGDANWRTEMMYKTLVHRVADKIPLDPRKVNAPSYAYAEAQESDDAVNSISAPQSNGPIIDVDPETGEVLVEEAADVPVEVKPEKQQTLADGPGF